MATKVLQTLGQRIVAARLAQTPRRMSQRALATKVGISTKSLNQIETGETLGTTVAKWELQRNFLRTDDQDG